MTTPIEAITSVLSGPACHALPEDWKALLHSWGEYLAINEGHSPRTVENYLRGAGRWMVYLRGQEIDLGQAQSSDVQAWQRAMYTEQGTVSATRSLNLTAVRRFYSWRENSGEPGNPAKNIRGPRKPERKPKKFTDEQLRAIFMSCNREKAMGRRDFALLLLIFNTGMRLSEVVGLKLHNLVLKVNVGVVRVFGKGARERILSFEGPAVEALRVWIADRAQIAGQEVETVFVGLSGKEKGQPLGRSGIEGVLNRALKNANIKKIASDPCGVHRLRSNFATALYDAGKDIKTIQHLLGHKRIETTELYIAISDRQLQQRLPADKTMELIGSERHVPRYVEAKTRNRH